MRAFIAVDVPEEIRKRVESLEDEFKMEGIVLVKKEAMHVTLQFLGELDATHAEKATEAMKRVRFKPFRVSLRGLSYFTPRMIKVIFVEILQGRKELEALYGKLGGELKKSGIGFEEERYTPHLTIARVKWVKDMRALRETLERNRGRELGSFGVSSIALKESTLIPEGPVYRTLYELRL